MRAMFARGGPDSPIALWLPVAAGAAALVPQVQEVGSSGELEPTAPCAQVPAAREAARLPAALQAQARTPLANRVPSAREETRRSATALAPAVGDIMAAVALRPAPGGAAALAAADRLM
jgi:hypothetical protein